MLLSYLLHVGLAFTYSNFDPQFQCLYSLCIYVRVWWMASSMWCKCFQVVISFVNSDDAIVPF